MRGKRELLDDIGSGRRGRSYLFAGGDAFLFESPVNWYLWDRHVWDMAPAYMCNASQIPMNLPAFASCLHCHVSGMQPPAEERKTVIRSRPFLSSWDHLRTVPRTRSGTL